MRVLLDEDVPIPALTILRYVLRGHDVHHIQELGWSGKKDPFIYRDAQRLRYDVIVTNDRRQMSDPDECDAVRRSRLHRVSYEQRPGIKRLALAIASIVAAMPDIVEELEAIRGQRLVSIISLSPRGRRYEVVDPRRNPPPYWR
jgi:hypothetical protein